MKCIECSQGQMEPGFVTKTFTRDGRTIVIDNVPALVCGFCSEPTFTSEVTNKLLSLARKGAASDQRFIRFNFNAVEAAVA